MKFGKTLCPYFFFFFVSLWDWVDFLAIGCKHRSGRPATAATTETKDKSDVLIWDGSWRQLKLVNSERYVPRLDKQNQRIRRVPPNRKMIRLLFRHDNATAHHFCAHGRWLQQWVELFSLILPTLPVRHFSTSKFWSPDECASRTPLCWTTNSWGGVREELRRAKSFTPQTYSVSRKNKKKIVVTAGDFV